MINNNKILTVSYGTFSCTLEGFDDSFGTMKAIAEYFRDLASDDRYFGAEPPQPDADMLARIAQKEISRRVEAREHEGKIVLSAMDDDAKPEAAPAIAAPIAAVASVVAAEQDAVEETAPDAVQPSQEGATESVSEQVAVEAEVAELEVEAVETAIAETTCEDAEVDDAEVDDAIAAINAQLEDETVEDVNDIVPGQPDAEVEAFFDSAASEDTFEEEAIAVAEPVAAVAAAPAADSIAAKLQRIRAVVAQHDDEDDDDDYSEDEHAVGDIEVPVASSDVMADARRDIEDALHADEMADLNDEEEDDDDDDIAGILSRLENADASADVDEAGDQDVAEADDDAFDALENLFDADEKDQAEVAATLQATEASKPANVVASEGLHLEAEPEVDASAARTLPRARVIKVKRADLEAAIKNGELEEYDDEDDAPLALDDLAPARTSGSSLSAEDEDELARELAELEADIDMDHAPAKAADIAMEADEVDLVDDQDDGIAAAMAEDHNTKPDASAETRTTARAKLPAIDADQSDDMSRLLAEADHQMDEPESATRRDAFAHLRAAVAAKKADEALGRSDDTIGGDDAYRNDLADVVRPRRPVSGEARTKRPGEGRPAPLKLVAEQRIDVASNARSAVNPVRPRRVAAVEPVSLEVEGDSFADFAAEMGATKLPDLLEAAAAYMSFVEGRDQFSRPQLMTKVRQAGPDGFSREDTLRSFGKLLREGKIEKIKAGRFAASEDIGFRPDQRAAG